MYIAHCLCVAWLGYQLKDGPVWCVKQCVEQVQRVEQPENTFFSCHFLCSCLDLDMGVFGYDNVYEPKECTLEVWHISPKAPHI